MIFSLEALEAKHGDALLLHFGTPRKPQLIVIDGGPSGVYTSTLGPRLAALKAARSPQAPMPVRMVMVSHMDDDHINGLLQLFQELDALRGQPLPYRVATLWHNSFDDLLNNAAAELTASLKLAVTAAAAGTPLPPNLPIHRHSALVLASVPQARELRNTAKDLGLTLNEGFGGLIQVPAEQKSKKLSLGGGLSFTVLGPRQERVKALQQEWDQEIKELGLARIAEFVDGSVFNLSSTIVLARAGGKTMLLTGDARGDDILAGLKNAQLLKNGVCHVDLLKLPHHGSDHNVSTSFFRQVVADHYVCSGNGKFGNPELATLGMVLEARGTARYTMWFTNREARLQRFFQKDKTPGKQYQVVYRKANEPSVRIDLADAPP